MAIRIFTNLTSLNAQRILGINNDRLAQSIERVSSGLRINRASDDPGGLAIAESLRSDIRVLRQGLRNLNDGLSVVNVMESALNEQTDMVIRMRELAAQAASGTITAPERASLQLEVNALVLEINRQALATEFNGQNLLDRSLTSLIVHFGTDASANSQLDIVAASGLPSSAVDMAFILSGTSTPFVGEQTANFGGSITAGTDLTGLGGATFTASISVDGVAVPISIDNSGGAADDFAGLITELNDPANLGTAATASITAGGNILITSSATGATASITITDGTVPATALFANTAGFVGFNTPIIGLDISSSATAAQTAVASLDTALDSLTTVRAGVAATQNRLTRILPGQAILVENLTAAESQIRDADIAEEVALLARNQILVETATAMVAQANIIPEQVLKLLPSI